MSTTRMIHIRELGLEDGINKTLFVPEHAIPSQNEIIHLYASKYSQKYRVVNREIAYSAYHGNDKSETPRDVIITIHVRKEE